MATAHGQWSAAVAHHPLGPFLYGYFVVLLVLHSYGAITVECPLPRLLVRGHYRGGVTVIVALVAVWLARLSLA